MITAVLSICCESVPKLCKIGTNKIDKSTIADVPNQQGLKSSQMQSLSWLHGVKRTAGVEIAGCMPWDRYPALVYFSPMIHMPLKSVIIYDEQSLFVTDFLGGISNKKVEDFRCVQQAPFERVSSQRE